MLARERTRAVLNEGIFLVGDDELPGRAGNQWRILNARHGRGIRVVPGTNGQLHWLPAASDSGAWESTGERPSFSLGRGLLGEPLAPGWYELSGYLKVEKGSIMLPSLYPHYVDHSALTSGEVALPEPDASGRIAMLLMFFDAVESLEFFPSVCPVRFRMRDFALSRVSRLHALRVMLGGPAEAERPHFAGRSLAWGRDVMERGLKRATDELYADYRERMGPRGVSEYDVWTLKYDTLGQAALDSFRQRARALADRGPLISVLLPVYDTPEPWLRRCFDSVLAQAWEKWELCVADDASSAPHVSTVLAEYAIRDQRIRVIRREHNGHVSEASNTALAMARGDFVALLDHDDELRPHALLRVAESVVADPDLVIVYSDEDKIDTDGKRFGPNFKPDWNPDLLLSQNYFCHLTAIRAALVRELGGFRRGFEGSQDYDLVLRCSERLESRQIRHIPEILYHWRAGEGSTALVRDAKDYATLAGTRALTEHLQRIGAEASVDTGSLPPTLYRVRWSLPQPPPKVSLIIPTRDRADLLRMCVESILAESTYPNFELVVVDNQSSDGAALHYLREIGTRDRVRVLRYDAPFNYSAINNWAARQCDGQLLGLVNNDIEVISPDWLEEMAGFAMRPDTGAVGAMLYYPDDTIQHAGVLLGMLGVAGHIYCRMPRGHEGHGGRGLIAQDLSAVTGACMLVRREVFEEVGGLDEQLPIAFNDIDFCLRVRERGYRNVWTPFAELYHHESASRGREDTDEKLARFTAEVTFMQERWGAALREDPAYNPNLSLQTHNFELAFPPRTPAAPNGTARTPRT
jgi:glycosyltransferase involved in cell wall biosynthesis